jgi:creatinine amidohydrolase
MKYELMTPDLIRSAIKKSLPVVLPAGVIEYHGEHLGVGVDTLVITRVIEEIEKQIDIVVLPAFFYGSASYAVEPPEQKGTIHISSETVFKFAIELFHGLLRIGFRNIYVIVHHQSENFTSGMPTDLAFKLAAKQAIFDFLEKNLGEGWWGSSANNYYQQQKKGKDPFSWIKIYPFMSEEIQKKFPIDHAGKLETSLMMVLCPEAVNMKKFSDKNWYTRTAKQATKDYGNEVKKHIIENLKKIFSE